MAFAPNSQLLGLPTDLSTVDTSQKWPLGTIIKAVDPTYGEAEFIYLKGVTSNVAGMLLSYDVTFTAALHTTELDKSRAIAVSMGAFDASAEYGWAQISGSASVKKANSVSFAAGAGLAGGSGLAIAVVSGLILNGALVSIVASAKSDVTTVRVMINRPHGPSDVS